MKMKGKLSIIFVMFMFFAFAFLAGTAYAGDYHKGSGLKCGDCHVMHASQQHAHDASQGGPTAGFPLAYTPSDFLLRATSTNALCISCHDGGNGTGDTAPDVLGAASYTTATLKRAAGGFYADDGATNLDYATPTASITSHNLGVAAGTSIPVSGALTLASPFTCASCHEPHGNTNYRNLKPQPDGKGTAVTITYANSTDTVGNSVFQTVSSTTTATSCMYTEYTDSNHSDEATTCVKPGNAHFKDEKISWFCRNCHQTAHIVDPSVANFTNDANLGGSDAGDTAAVNDQWKKHPVSHVTMGEANTNGHVSIATWNQNVAGTNSHPVVASASKTVPANDNQVVCITCHQAHGSSHQFMLVWDDHATDALEDATSAQGGMIKTCDSCHNKQGLY